jgi:hypothetical protein
MKKQILVSDCLIWRIAVHAELGNHYSNKARLELVAMSDNSLQKLLLQLGDNVLNCLTVDKLALFINLASRLKNDIILTQSPRVPPFDPPEFLPPSIRCFLGNSCELTLSCVDRCWNALKGTVWNKPDLLGDPSEAVFAQHGLKHGLCERYY